MFFHLRGMKFFAALFLLLAGLASGLAQSASGLRVELSLPQDQFLTGQDVPLKVKITNLSGQTVALGDAGDWLTFSVEGGKNALIVKTGNPPVEGAGGLPSLQSLTRTVNLTPHFSIQKPGTYRVVARLKVPAWNLELASLPQTFTTVNGISLQEIDFGVPNPDNTTGQPEGRKYILQKVDESRTAGREIRLYVRVTDESGTKTFRVFPVARMLAFAKPDVRLDRFNNLHILHLVSQRSFSYCTVNPSGQVLTRQLYDYRGESRPGFQVQEDGRITIAGGMRHYTDADIPPREVEEALSAPAPAKP